MVVKLRRVLSAVAVAVVVAVSVGVPSVSASAVSDAACSQYSGQAYIDCLNTIVNGAKSSGRDFAASPNKLRKYMLNVTSKVLGKATPNKWRAEQIANDHKYNFSWENLEATFGAGPSLGPYNGSPDTATDYAIKNAEQGLKGGKGGKPMTVPLGKLGKVTKVLGAAGNVVAFLGAAEAGFQVGAGVSRFLGVNVDDVVCSPDALGGLVSTFVGTDCDAIKNFDASYSKNVDAVLGNTWANTCAAGRCVQLLGDSIRQYDIATCLTTTGTYVSGATLFLSWVDPAGTTHQVQVRDAPWASSSGLLPGCTTIFSGATNTAPGTFSSALNGWTSAYNSTKIKLTYQPPSGDSTVSPYTPVIPGNSDPDRVLTCTIKGDDGNTYSQDTPAFKESTGKVPTPQCPALPTGVAPADKVTVKECNKTTTTCTTVATQDVDTEYSKWWTAYPECRTGGCRLDLISLGTGAYPVSCFDLDTGCADWFKDPNKADNYECHYGIHTVDLDECNAYAGLFVAGRIEACAPYSDPLTGQWSGGKNTEGCTDPGKTVDGTVTDPSTREGCTAMTTGGFDVFGTAMAGARCVLEWAFVPRGAVVTAETAELAGKFVDKAPGQIATMISGWTFLPSMTGCKIDADRPWVDANGVTHHKNVPVVDACSGPMAALAGVSRGIVDVGFAVMVFLVVKRQTAKMVDFT